ncbi:alcohol dehydrogenase catalytic domain-containing protein [Natronosalvus rutilus]|uniref:Alcohol dehydrogenase catalytic domain-containing protein n=1 Tax=Natronosalvus rutilus TaxID=2953753 RepID=A0A9E7SVD0_9EURY|nr:alcohol dehydrogenase catalytic domain-containing protein [Natronosalvus rutilus]UTF55734.1 alcohol dehydrogenase catalytic domain-containing protein [Natronosalvus rutilus]
MRAAAYTSLGESGTIEAIDLEDPDPEPGSVVVRVEACSVNHRDLWNLEGAQGVGESDLPYVGGSDVAGVVEAVGDGVNDISTGDRVVLNPVKSCGKCRFCRDGPENQCENFGIYDGGFGELAAVDSTRLEHVPNSVDLVDAAAIPIAYMTAYHMIRRANVEPGDLVFVPGATGGVGVAAIQLLDVIGARSIATSTSAEKLDRLTALGTDHTIQSADVEELREGVEAIGAPDVTLNHLGGKYTAVGLEVLDRAGKMVICGRTVSRRSDIDIRDLYWDHKRVIGSTMGTQADLARLVELLADGQLEPEVGETYALEDTIEAFEAIGDRSAFGKQIVEPQE